MSTSKTPQQTFQSDWAAAAQWAQSQKIAPSSYLPVYNLDAARYLQYGHAMSQGERTQAILAAAGRPQADPQPTSSPTNIFSNVFHNAENLFVGLDPLHMVPNLFDTAKNAVEHPEEQIIQPIADLAKISTPFVDSEERQKAMQQFSATVLGPHAISSFAPGAFDAAQLFRGQAGAKVLAENPLTAILDVVPLGKLGMTGLAKTGPLAEAVAKTAGVAPEELGDMTPGQLAFKVLKNRPTKTMGVRTLPDGTPEGTKALTNLTTGQRIAALRNHIGMGKEQAEVDKELNIHQEVATHEKKMLGRLNAAATKLNEGEQQQVNMYLATEYATDARPLWQKLDDDRWTDDQREYLDSVVELDNKLKEIGMQAGELRSIETIGPDGQPMHELYLITNGSRGKIVSDAKDNLDAAKDALDKGTETFNSRLAEAQDLDSTFGKLLPVISARVQNLYGYIKASLPDLSDSKQYETLRDSLPVKQRLERATPKSKLSSAKNLEDMFGLDEKVEERVNRGRDQALPFSGKMGEWSDQERAAWYESYKWEEKKAGGTPSRSDVKANAVARLKMLGALRDVKLHAPVSGQAARVLSELISPGGLMDQIQRAFDDQRWDDFLDLTTAANKKLHNKSFQSPTRSQELYDLTETVHNLYLYARKRKSITDELMALWMGRKRGTGKLVKKAYKTSVAKLTADYDKAADKFLKESRDNPPAAWDQYYYVEYSRLLMESDAGREAAQAAIDTLRSHKMPESTLTKLQQDPQALVEMMDINSRNSEENAMLPNVNIGAAKEISQGAKDLIWDMRSKGMEPLYLPTLKQSDKLEGEGVQLYNVNLHKSRVSKKQASYEKKQTNTSRSTIYDFQAALNKAVHEYVVNKHELEFQQDYMPQFLYHDDDIKPMIHQYFAKRFEEVAIGSSRFSDADSLYNHIIENELNLVGYDPHSLWGITHPKHINGGYYIDKDIAKAFDDRWNGDENPLMKGYDVGTKVFRTSILGYSPRFTAHVVLGGAMMTLAHADPVALLTNASMAWRMAWTKRLPEEVLGKFNLNPEDPTLLSKQVITEHSMQEGYAEHTLQHAMSYSGAQLSLQMRIAAKFGKDATNLKNPDWFTHYLNVLPDANFRLTSFATNLYRSLMFLQGMGKAARKDHFYEDTYNATTGKIERVQHEMTPQQALKEGFNQIDKVMGDIRAMTPIERDILTRMFPFWSWTRHVLQYVMRYPADHPYRAMFLSNLSWMGMQEQDPTLPARTQLLFFLGQPNAEGQVHAIDARALNPLRDTAQYASLSGWISALNPIITAPFSKIDPNITYGTNVLYPNITYDSIYGTNDSTQQGSWLGGVESIVPQVSALDAALNLSGQFSYLQAKGDRNSLYKEIFQSLNVPFLQDQSINLRQMAATDEMKIYNQAKGASANYWTTGDVNYLQGYETVPDPRYGTSPVPNIPVNDLIAIYQQTANQWKNTGLSPVDVTPELTNPQI